MITTWFSYIQQVKKDADKCHVADIFDKKKSTDENDKDSMFFTNG